MNPQIHKALDGDSTAQALTPAERAELTAVEQQIDAALRAIPAEPLPDLAPAVLARIRRESSRARTPIASLEPPPSSAPRPRASHPPASVSARPAHPGFCAERAIRAVNQSLV